MIMVPVESSDMGSATGVENVENVDNSSPSLIIDKAQYCGFNSKCDLIKFSVENSGRDVCSHAFLRKDLIWRYPKVFRSDNVKDLVDAGVKEGLLHNVLSRNGSGVTLYKPTVPHVRVARLKRVHEEDQRSEVFQQGISDNRRVKLKSGAPSDAAAAVSHQSRPMRVRGLSDSQLTDMLQSGWQFSPIASAHIGLRIRVFSGPQVFCDGQVNAVLPPSFNGGRQLLHVLLDNLAATCMDTTDALSSRLFLLNNAEQLGGEEYSRAYSATYKALVQSSGPRHRDPAATIIDAVQPEVECYWFSPAGSFFLRSFPSVCAAAVTLGVSEQWVEDSLRRHSSKQATRSSAVSFRAAKSSHVRTSPRSEVHISVIRTLLSASLTDLASPGQQLTAVNLGANQGVLCLAAGGMTSVAYFAGISHAASAVGVPLAGLKMALVAAKTEVVPFGGLYWQLVPHASVPRHSVPVEVLRAMVLTQNCELVERLQDTASSQSETVALVRGASVDGSNSSAGSGTSCSIISSSSSSSSGVDPGNSLRQSVGCEEGATDMLPDAQQTPPSQTFTCLSLDDVPLFVFRDATELCTALNCRELFVRLCCLGALHHYCGFRWQFGDLIAAANIPQQHEARVADPSLLVVDGVGSADGEGGVLRVVREIVAELLDVVGEVDNNAMDDSTSVEPIPNSETAESVVMHCVDSHSTLSSVKAEVETPKEQKVPISSRDLPSLANLFMKDFEPRLVLMVAARKDSEEEDRADDESSEASFPPEDSAIKEAEMRSEGWLFRAQDSEYIGLRVRRFFPDHCVSDACVVAFLPAALNDGEPLWHLLHDDGDREDVDLMVLRKGLRHLSLDLQTDPDNATATLTAQLPLSGGFADHNTEKLRHLSVERSAANGENIDAVLALLNQERSQSSSAAVQPVAANVCTLVVKIISNFAEAGVSMADLLMCVAASLKPHVATFEKSVKAMVLQLSKISIVQRLPTGRYAIARKYAQSDAVQQIDSIAHRDALIFQSSPVQCVAANGELLFEFKNIQEVCETLRVDAATVKKVCLGAQKTTRNLRFRMPTLTGKTPTITNAAHVGASRQSRLDRVKAIMSAGVRGQNGEEGDCSDEDSSGSGYYVGAQRARLGRKQSMKKDEYPPTKPDVGRNHQADVPDISFRQTADPKEIEMSRLRVASEMAEDGCSVTAVATAADNAYWEEGAAPRNAAVTNGENKYMQLERLLTQQRREKEQEVLRLLKPTNRCSLFPDLLVGDFILRRLSSPEEYRQHLDAFLARAKECRVRQGAIVPVKMLHGTPSVHYVCVLRDYCEGDVPLTLPEQQQLGADKDCAVATPSTADKVVDQPVVVYDGQWLRHVSLSSIFFNDEDEVLAALAAAGGNISEALSAVESAAKTRLVRQWSSREVGMYVDAVRVHKTNAPDIFRFSGLHKRRSVKEVIDFHYRFYWLNSSQTRDRGLLEGRWRLVNLFKCAELLATSDAPFSFRGDAAAEDVSRLLQAVQQVFNTVFDTPTPTVAASLADETVGNSSSSSVSNTIVQTGSSLSAKRPSDVLAPVKVFSNASLLVSSATAVGGKQKTSASTVDKKRKLAPSGEEAIAAPKHLKPAASAAVPATVPSDAQTAGTEPRQLTSRTKKPYPHVILEVLSKPEYRVVGADDVAISRCLQLMYPSFHYKPHHLLTSLEKMLVAGVLQRHPSTGLRFKVTDTGLSVLRKLNQSYQEQEALRLTADTIDGLIARAGLVEAVVAQLKRSPRGNTSRSLRAMLMREDALNAELRALDPEHLLDVAKTTIRKVQTLGYAQFNAERTELTLSDSADPDIVEGEMLIDSPFPVDASVPLAVTNTAGEDVLLRDTGADSALGEEDRSFEVAEGDWPYEIVSAGGLTDPTITVTTGLPESPPIYFSQSPPSHTEETATKKSQKKSGQQDRPKHSLSAAVDCFSVRDNKFLRRFASRQEAADQLGISCKKVTSCCTGFLQAIDNLRFSFVDSSAPERPAESMVSVEDVQNFFMPLRRKAGAAKRSMIAKKPEGLAPLAAELAASSVADMSPHRIKVAEQPGLSLFEVQGGDEDGEKYEMAADREDDLLFSPMDFEQDSPGIPQALLPDRQVSAECGPANAVLNSAAEHQQSGDSSHRDAHQPEAVAAAVTADEGHAGAVSVVVDLTQE